MRIHWSKTVLLAITVSLPYGGLTAPCKQKTPSPRGLYKVYSHTLGTNRKCSGQVLEIREAQPIIPIIPIPKPVLPPIIPKPIAPKPVEPAPVPPRPHEPAPPPKPIEPAPPTSGSGIQCKRAPGDACPNIARFEDANLEALRVKGRDAQAALVVAQRAKPVKDVDKASVSDNYAYEDYENVELNLGEDEMQWLTHGGAQAPFSGTRNGWTKTTIRNKDGQNEKLDNIILDTYQGKEDRAMVIADSRNRENDKAPPEDKLRWTDMAMFSWKKFCEDKGIQPREVRYWLRNNIQGGDSAIETQTAIDGAITRTKGDPGQINTFRSDPDAPGITTDELAAFQLIAGTAHGHRVLLMLKDFPETMKNVRIESFSVTTRDTEAADEEYNILIKFGLIDNP